MLAEFDVIVSWPVAEPVVRGSKVSVSEIDWPGFSVAGRLTGETEKPAPLTPMELTVTAVVPLEVSVTVCVVGVLITTEPNGMLVAFALRAEAAAFSCSATVFEMLPVLAVRLAVCVVLTEETAALKLAPVAVAGIVTDAGTTTALLLLARATVTPPVGAEPVSVTLQESLNAPVIDSLLQLTELTVGVVVLPVPLSATETDGALLWIESCPVTELDVVGLNWIDNTAAWPGLRVAGKLMPLTENPVPEMASELIVTGAVPVDVTVTDFETAVPTETFPNERELALSVSAGVEFVPPVPLRAIERAGALLEMIEICPVTAPAVVGLN